MRLVVLPSSITALALASTIVLLTGRVKAQEQRNLQCSYTIEDTAYPTVPVGLSSVCDVSRPTTVVIQRGCDPYIACSDGPCLSVTNIAGKQSFIKCDNTGYETDSLSTPCSSRAVRCSCATFYLAGKNNPQCSRFFLPHTLPAVAHINACIAALYM